MILRPAVRADLPAMLALLEDEDRVVDPASVEVGAAHEAAFEAIASDARNELLVLVEGEPGGGGGVLLGFLQVTYIPGLGRGAGERALLEAVRIRPDRRGAGLGGELVRRAVERARARGCTLVQLTSHKDRADAHRFYERFGFARSHEGFRLPLG
ncbi:GNAT family N-acetyltransferase [Yinghuangia seranimata]|uniref:GNAT family N-acetyltransferase n=1 Tax=Yinghuangia seranimata TaxID=408067 RepID=UPI00248B901C|nr:GNAT family N-acetyltransferase [Yinghuangia seranimata]MDI2127695.1 GNAT family N-acetyltransferase [Yinghuangia seranimata]